MTSWWLLGSPCSPLFWSCQPLFWWLAYLFGSNSILVCTWSDGQFSFVIGETLWFPTEDCWFRIPASVGIPVSVSFFGSAAVFSFIGWLWDGFWPRWGSSARLETRTKESNKYASHILNESIRRTEREAHISAFGVNRATFVNRCSTGRGLAIGWIFEPEHTCWDPKGGDLCLNRTKPRETWVEVRSDVDVQIAR